MPSKLEMTLQLIDKANASDPKNGAEILYSQRMLTTLHAFEEDASEPLTLACYAQHVCRWKLARKDYPTGLNGYLTWRTELAKLHAGILADAMLMTILSGQAILFKKSGLKKTPTHKP